MDMTALEGWWHLLKLNIYVLDEHQYIRHKNIFTLHQKIYARMFILDLSELAPN